MSMGVTEHERVHECASLRVSGGISVSLAMCVSPSLGLHISLSVSLHEQVCLSIHVWLCQRVSEHVRLCLEYGMNVNMHLCMTVSECDGA